MELATISTKYQMTKKQIPNESYTIYEFVKTKTTQKLFNLLYYLYYINYTIKGDKSNNSDIKKMVEKSMRLNSFVLIYFDTFFFTEKISPTT